MQSMLVSQQLGKIGNLAALFADPLLLLQMMFRFVVAVFGVALALLMFALSF